MDASCVISISQTGMQKLIKSVWEGFSVAISRLGMVRYGSKTH